jgi:hypothetical protein
MVSPPQSLPRSIKPAAAPAATQDEIKGQSVQVSGSIKRNILKFKRSVSHYARTSQHDRPSRSRNGRFMLRLTRMSWPAIARSRGVTTGAAQSCCRRPQEGDIQEHHGRDASCKRSIAGRPEI